MANHLLTGSDIQNGSLTGADVRSGSIRGSDLHDGTITGKDIDRDTLDELNEDDGLRALIRRQIAAIQRQPGPQGPAGPQGPQGAQGSPGPAGASALDPVPSGQTIRGAVGGDFHAFDATASDFGVDVSLPMPAANPLSDDDVSVNVSLWKDAGGQTAPTTTDTDAGCNGTLDNPTAPAGKVCIYVSGADHAFNLSGFSVRFGTEASRFGFKLKWDASQTGDTFVDGVWAYTAP